MFLLSLGLLVYMAWPGHLYGGVQVDDSQLEIHRIFHTKKVLCITDIGQVIIDKKDAMILYDKMGKKLIKIDALSDNYDHLLNLLKSQNIEISNKYLK